MLSANRSNPVSTNTPRRADDPDWVYFRGFGAKKREDIVEDLGVTRHGPLLLTVGQETPVAPPRRKRPQRLINLDETKPALPLRRSFSFTDAQHIAQAVYEGKKCTFHASNFIE